MVCRSGLDRDVWYPTVQVDFHARGHPYKIIFGAMLQVNLSTGMARDAHT